MSDTPCPSTACDDPCPTSQCNDPRVTAMELLVDVQAGVTARLTPVLDAHGISGHDFDVLMRIARSPESSLRMSDLARQTASSTSGMTRVVDRLERRGLVAREPHPSDRRVHYVRLLDGGSDKLAALMPEVLAAIEHWFTGQLSGQCLEQLLTGLRTVRGVVLPEAEEADLARQHATSGQDEPSRAGGLEAATSEE
ncbi:DNA-binding MarR family transcriptional regulator [Haloactinospora alba]|uniref:DNA-binding MarR family transcriptional regulator n=1 Tax=Haloactinospora alba TaxID=405555 RepID=A0A543NNQ3_9ACTN|nr:MarR family transcriptional regulator [Haloactinospora alba]TQN33452.1 DNA-binding MarR family transcriptional regulator [Haloactinospora alba]